MKTFKLPITILVMILGIVGCKKDKDEVETPPIVNEEEVITTVKLMFTDIDGMAADTEAVFRDPDGEGGQSPDIFDDIVLAAGTTYQCTILLLNETVTPIDTISNEVLAEGDEHLFCFDVAGADATIVRTDTDGTYEIGLESQWTTGLASQGTVTVVLKHQPGIKDGTCGIGETDVEVVFDATIQ
ncbi:MAG: type 1 periplasmic binding fold superfamily protein [Cryomorphaceae bacterium]|nr:type 1 periplasmic binding fold superfamily protein [Cryomorphaceae bacterium]